ncbi:unnamed protein product [Penicillium salamii]|nr:unnamed protein product [Penicillium salamii]CAG8404716.1 unnamed protein product [Penicillium salamii]
MSPPVLKIAAGAVALLLLWALLSEWKYAQKAYHWGCGRLPCYPSDPFGINVFIETWRADKQNQLLRLFERQFETMADREGRFVATFRLKQLGSESYMTADPLNIQAVLATKFKDFDLGTSRRNAFYPLMGHSIATNEGEAWSRSRALLRPQFVREQISDLDLEERHVLKAMQVMPLVDGQWTAPVDIQTIFFRFTLDSATEFFFGKSVESQLSVLTDRHTAEDKFCHFLTTAQRYAAQRVRFERVAWILNNKESREAENEVHKYVDKHVKRAIDAVREMKTHNKQSDRYLFLNALAEATQDPVELRSELLLTVMAGRDTTASMLTWTVLLLARHTTEFQNLRQIIIDEFGSYSKPRNLTFQSLKSCRYLQYVMNESLRLYPVAPFNTRTAVRDTTLPRGGGPDGSQPIFVRKGQVIAYTVHVLHRRKDIWGIDADEFKPSRWATSKAGWEYLPFNGGPRICLGQQFALTNVGYVLVRLLQRFDVIENVNADKEIREILTLGSFPAENLCVRLHEATS